MVTVTFNLKTVFGNCRIVEATFTNVTDGNTVTIPGMKHIFIAIPVAYNVAAAALPRITWATNVVTLTTTSTSGSDDYHYLIIGR